MTDVFERKRKGGIDDLRFTIYDVCYIRYVIYYDI
jgi:hypothetical protein